MSEPQDLTNVPTSELFAMLRKCDDELIALYDASRERTLMTADEASAYTRAITADEEPGPVQENDHD